MKEYIMSPEELKALQKAQRELISEVDRICKKNNIRYGMVGGTMLGAIRHKGYIPWDDDADIGFLRSEYERFLKACKTDLDYSKYYVQNFRNTKGYRWGYGKLRMKDTLFVRLGQEHMPFPKGISIDLMPFDAVPDGFFRKRIHFFLCFLFRKALWSEAGRINEKNPVKRFTYMVLSLIPERALKKAFFAFIKRNHNNKTKTVRILTFPTPKGVYGYDRKWYTELSMHPFDNLTLPGAEDFDGYLTIKYGDYMKLPSEDKRKIHPISELRLPKN